MHPQRFQREPLDAVQRSIGGRGLGALPRILDMNPIMRELSTLPSVRGSLTSL